LFRAAEAQRLEYSKLKRMVETVMRHNFPPDILPMFSRGFLSIVWVELHCFMRSIFRIGIGYSPM
jgi:hypothetical protein